MFDTYLNLDLTLLCPKCLSDFKKSALLKSLEVDNEILPHLLIATVSTARRKIEGLQFSIFNFQLHHSLLKFELPVVKEYF